VKTSSGNKIISRLFIQFKSYIQNPDNTLTNHLIYARQLYDLLDNIDTPVKFQSDSIRLKEKLLDPREHNQIEQHMESAVSLIVSINQFLLDEHQSTEKFLDDILLQLASLESQTVQASQSNQQTVQNRQQLNAAIHHQLDSIRDSTSSAYELSSLQKSIQIHLQELTLQFKNHKQEEDKRLQESQRQLDEMAKKLKELEEETRFLRQSLKLAHAKAFVDALTELPNRLAYNEKFDAEFKYSKRYQTPLSLIIWDIDFFKQVNDTYGHEAGDQVLKEVAHLIQKNSRETDFVARYGGEEFVMLLPNSHAQQALVVSDKIRNIIRNTTFTYNEQPVKVTMSCGISEYQKTDEKPEDIFKRADDALYEAKHSGRNCCKIFSKPQ